MFERARRFLSAAAAAEPRPWHHLPNGRFRNPIGSPMGGGSAHEWAAFACRRVFVSPKQPTLPDGHVLTEAQALTMLAAGNGHDRVTWLGHASFLITLQGRTILIDPFLDSWAAPFAGLGPRRYAGPSLTPESLPPIDILLLSHNHYDHLVPKRAIRVEDSGCGAIR